MLSPIGDSKRVSMQPVSAKAKKARAKSRVMASVDDPVEAEPGFLGSVGFAAAIKRFVVAREQRLRGVEFLFALPEVHREIDAGLVLLLQELGARIARGVREELRPVAFGTIDALERRDVLGVHAKAP